MWIYTGFVMELDDISKPIIAVTGSQKPYIFDLPHLLSLPKGFEFRFRYRHRWVQEQLLRNALESDSNLAGKQVFLLFHSQDNKRIIPIRRGTILAIESIGPMVFVRFRLGEFVKVDLDITAHLKADGQVESARNALSSLGNSLIGKVGDSDTFDLAQGLPAGWYAREVDHPHPDDIWDKGDEAAAWARIASVLQSESSLRGIPLFYVLGFLAEAGDLVRPSIIQNRFSLTREEIYGFHLCEAERYRMRVIEWCEPSVGISQPPVRVGCQFNPMHLELEGSSDLVVGRYDVMEFTFSALQPGYSEVALNAEPLHVDDPRSIRVGGDQAKQQTSEEARAWAGWPSIFVARIPVVVKVKARQIIFPVLAVFAGIGLYVYVAPRMTGELKSVVELSGLGILAVFSRPILAYLDDLLKLKGAIGRFWAAPVQWFRKDIE